MSLILEQWAFLKDVAKLIVYADMEGLTLTAGEMWRPPELQQIYIASGRSWTANSRHLSRLAFDVNFFNKDLTLCTDHAIMLKTGEFWESLDPKNVHGLRKGPDEGDLVHFERRV
jgi:hypothetical protein